MKGICLLLCTRWRKVQVLFSDYSNSVAEVNVPVIGGHAGITILPLFSQVLPHSVFFLFTILLDM